MNLDTASTDIAIIGMSALFPGAKDLPTYWQNILNKVDAVQEAPDNWAMPYFDPTSKENDRIYTRKGGFLGKLAEFNAIEFGVMPNSVEGSDPDQFLALKVARDALADAGYTEKPFDREKTGVIVGRGTYINRGWTNLLQHGTIVDQTLDLLRQLQPGLDRDTLSEIRKELKASLLPFNAEMAPGIVPNVVTGRIANRLGLMGPNYIIDAACSSSLVAIELAIKELLSNRCDMMLAGGVHAPSAPPLHMMFCQIGALSRSNIRPFDKSADGTLLAEGLGIVVLKRLADAERDCDRIYAVIKGIGSSSDGKALGLLAPRLEGEVLAMQRAYTESGIDPDTVTLVEAHGTGIPLGDKTEINSLTKIFGQRRGMLPHRALGSVKSMIGHSTLAAGAASLIKTALALYYKILPPTLCDEVNPDLEIENTPFYINNETRPWIQGKAPRRAGINAFGFGGVNAHAVLEEYTGQQTKNAKLLQQQLPTELLIFSGDSRTAVIDAIKNVQQILQVNPNIALGNLAYSLSAQSVGSHRLAIIAKDVSDLESKLNLALEKLQDTKRKRLQVRSGIYYAEIAQTAEPQKIAFLFPGEGSQYPNMLADLCLYFPNVREWFDLLDETFAETREHPPSRFIFPPPTGLTDEERRLVKEQLFSMDVGSETVFTASMALYDLLSDFGIKSDVMLGHSTGESAALIASCTVRKVEGVQLMEKIRYLNRIYSALEAAGSIPRGVLLTVGAVDPSVVQQVVDKAQGCLYLAMDNCPNQAVLFGNESDIEAATVQLKATGGICTRLPFDRAYHTPLFDGVATAFQKYYDTLDVGTGSTCLYSCATAEAFPTEPEAIRTLAAKQWSSRVRFRETIEKLYNQNIKTFIEVGPSSNLTNFVDDILRGRDYLAIASNNQRRSSLEHLEHLLARLWVNGTAINMTPLYRYRQVTPMVLDTAILKEKGDRKVSPVLELTMPVMHLKPEFIETIQDKLSPPQANPEPVIPAVSTQRNTEGFNGERLNVKGLDSWNDRRVEGWNDGRLEDNQPPANLQPATQLQQTTSSNQPPANLQPITQLQLTTPSNLQPTTQLQPTPQTSNKQQPTTDSRLSLLCAHFDLMQEFLESQGRVMTSLHHSWSNSNHTTNGSLPITLAPAPLTHEEAWPLLGQIIERDFQHLYCERRFDLERDSFLHDHTLGSKPSQRQPELLALSVIPFTMSMEILAEAAAYLVGGDKQVVEIYNIRSYRWLALEQGYLDVGILAQVLPKQDEQTWDVQVQLFQCNSTEASDRVLVFEGYVRLCDQLQPSLSPITSALENPKPHIWSDAELYTTGMFHGERFQSVKHIREVAEQGIEADLQVISLANFFSHTQQPVFQIDAPLLDAATQLVAYWVVDKFRTTMFHTFPFQIRAFHQYQAQLSAGSKVLCRGLMRFTSEQQIESNFDFIDETGQVIARLEGLQEIYLTLPQDYHYCRQNPPTTYWSEPWLQMETGLVCRRILPQSERFLEALGGVMKHIVAHLMLNAQERDYWYGLPEKGHRRREWLLGRIAAKDALRQWVKQTFQLELAPVDIQILSTQSGKPLVHCPELERLAQLPDLSISHSRGYIVAALASPGRCIGIDVQRFEGIRVDDLLSGAFTQQELSLLTQLPPLDRARSIIGLWCAKEAAAKAAGMGLMGDPRQWQVTHYSPIDQQVVIIHAGKSFQIQLYCMEGEILAICQHSLQ